MAAALLGLDSWGGFKFPAWRWGRFSVNPGKTLSSTSSG
jgi:hypothetical protein